MYPGMFAWWKHVRRNAGSYAAAGCGAHHGWGGVEAAGWGHGHGHGGGEGDGDFGGGSFGVRRPLRFLAYKLDLNDKQVTELARILDDLKTERAQAAVDNRRATSVFADVLSADTFDEGRLGQAASDRVKSAERLKDAVVKALSRIHAILDPEQRSKLAYLIRTGALVI